MKFKNLFATTTGFILCLSLMLFSNQLNGQSCPCKTCCGWNMAPYELKEGECHMDGNQEYKMQIIENGNLVVTQYEGTQHAKRIWESKTANSGGNVLRMQPDGNLVLYKNNGTQPHDAVWSTDTHGLQTMSGTTCGFAVKKNSGIPSLMVNSDLNNPVWDGVNGKK